jgi:thiol-disulfide isomerase/thioredoxin
MKAHQLCFLAILLGALCASIDTSAEHTSMVQRTSTTAAELPVEGKLPSLGHATAWLNSEPLSAADLRGKVVLIDFWTYTCINWRRTLPYLRAWEQKYRDNGLVVIGVHTPEFSFEKDIGNVRGAAKDQNVDYPIAMDSDYAIWNAFKNQYWPALYFVDAQGRIRHHQFGEGDYEQSEVIIQQLLAEAATVRPNANSCQSRGTAQKPPPTGQACGLRKRMWAMRAPSTSPLRAERFSTNLGSMLPPRG